MYYIIIITSRLNKGQSTIPFGSKCFVFKDFCADHRIVQPFALCGLVSGVTPQICSCCPNVSGCIVTPYTFPESTS